MLPAVLSDGDLSAGIAAIVSRLDLPIKVDVPSQRFPETTEASAHFIVAEALTNVVKHAHASRAEVRIAVDGASLRIRVSDDGVGGADRDGHGLLGLVDRVSALGGTFELDSPVRNGTVLTATLPAGGTALEPKVVSRMIRRPRVEGPFDALTQRERDVLAAMAESKSNRGIAETLLKGQASVEKHITAIFEKLDIEPAPTEHRRVLAVLTYLRSAD
jgi:DNA-binding CsgD family transcriptional regulator